MGGYVTARAVADIMERPPAVPFGLTGQLHRLIARRLDLN
jgi:hypothetical protein